MRTTTTNDRRSQRPRADVKRSLRNLAFCAAPLLIGACSSGSGTTNAESGISAAQAIIGTDCGFTVESKVHGIGKNGFNVEVKVTNVTGATSTAFSVLVQADQAQLANVAHGSFQTTDFGYLLVADSSLANSKLDPGQTYTFELKFDGTYTSFTPIVMSSNGANCDQQAPDVSLTESGNFFTASGTLNLAATASDNVAVAKVVFLQDGTPIGTTTTAPYTLSVPVTNAINGRHVYSAVAYDLVGNSAAQSAGRVLVAINNKFFGTAVTTAADYTYFSPIFNQVTPGNAGKWGSVEPVQDPIVENWNWAELDQAYALAQSKGIPFKLHTLVWGSQQPSWVSSLSAADQLKAIDTWMGAVAARYPKAALVDVVNEPLHAPPSYAAALGGAGVTGWDWVITAFQMARSHFPNAELLLNDYSTLMLSSTTQDYLKVINLLKDRGLIDGIGEQGHFYERSPDVSTISNNLNALVATGLPVYISELDLNLADDALQATRMSQIFPIFWSNPSVVGVTHWGYLQGTMWQPNAYLTLSDGMTPRPALTWLECYMAGGTNCPVPTYVPQPHNGDCAGITLPAPEFDTANGLIAAGSVVAYANDGSWFGFNRVAFQNNWNSLNVSYAHNVTWTSPPSLTIHLGSLSNAPVATVALPVTGDWSTLKTVTVPWTPIAGAQDVFVKFNGAGANVASIQFAAPVTAPNVVQNGTFEYGTYYWYTWGSSPAATVSTSTARAHSGTQSLLVSGRTGNSPAATDITSIVKPGTSYPFSLWASIHTATGASSQLNVTQAATCKAADGSTSTAYGWIANPKTVSDGANWAWVQFSGTIAVPNCNLTQLQIWVEGADGSDPVNKPLADQLYVDDVQIIDNSNVCAPTNLLSNSNFESGIDSWTGNGANASVTSSWFHSGTKSLMGVATSSSTNPNLIRDIKASVTPGKKYNVSAWVSGGTGGAWIQFVDNYGCGTGGWTPIQSGAWVNGGTWNQITGILDYSACTGAFSYAQLWVGGGGGSTIYVDDVSLTLVQ